MANKHDPRPVSLSHSCYRAVLRAYPRRFQREYRNEVACLFRDCCRDAYHTQGAWGLAGVWGRAVLDLGKNVPQEHMEQLTTRHPEPPRVFTRCTYCSEEIIVDDARCIYCGARLSDPLATATAVRPVDRPGNFFDDTPAAVLAAPVRFEHRGHEHHV
jgi:hypothetical protein